METVLIILLILWMLGYGVTGNNSAHLILIVFIVILIIYLFEHAGMK